MILDNLMDKLPDIYNKNENAGIYKIIKLAADQIAQGENTLRTIQEWRDIDRAEGKVLDKIGKDVGQPREGLSDTQFRQAIKIKIRANLSGGEIETLNSIGLLLVGERFQYIDEGWTLPTNHPIGPKPAMMLFTVKADGHTYGLPMAEIDEISGGGIAANWHLLIDTDAQVRTRYTKSEETARVYPGKPGVDPEYQRYTQTYLAAGEGVVGAHTLNTKGAV